MKKMQIVMRRRLKTAQPYRRSLDPSVKGHRLGADAMDHPQPPSRNRLAAYREARAFEVDPGVMSGLAQTRGRTDVGPEMGRLSGLQGSLHPLRYRKRLIDRNKAGRGEIGFRPTRHPIGGDGRSTGSADGDRPPPHPPATSNEQKESRTG